MQFEFKEGLALLKAVLYHKALNLKHPRSHFFSHLIFTKGEGGNCMRKVKTPYFKIINFAQLFFFN